jgi:DNA-nicking Smr family endonuclease
VPRRARVALRDLAMLSTLVSVRVGNDGRCEHISWRDPGDTGNDEAMKPRRPAVSPEDQALFLAAIGGAIPLGKRDRIPVPAAPPSAVRVAELPAAVKLTVEGDGQRYAARAPGVSRAQLADLRAGKLHVELALDLHGHSVADGLAELREVVTTSRRIGRRCLLIIHGKGTRSELGAPLREAVLGELLGPLSGLVHALATAAPSDGGNGATYLVLKGPP